MEDTPDTTGRSGIPGFRDIQNNTDKSWWRDRALRINVFHCAGLCMTLFFNGYDGSLFNGLQSITEWENYFGHPTSNTLSIMNSSGYLPGIVASFVGVRVAYFIGRRWPVWIGCVINIVGSIIMSLSTSVGMFCAGRVVLGFGTNLALATAPTLLQEIAHPRLRAQLSGAYTCIYYVAAIISAGACLGCMSIGNDRSWRIPCFLQLIGPIVCLAMTFSMPESPRNKADVAYQILKKYHANGIENDPLVDLEVREIEAALEDEQRNRQTTYLDLYRGKGNIHRSIINHIVAAGSNWVGNGIVSYYLSPILASLGISNARTQLEILLGMQIWNLLVSSSAAFLIEKVGRRPLWITSTAGMFITLVITMGLSGATAANGSRAIGFAAVPFLFLFYGSYDIAWTPLQYSYCVEIFPFSLRTKASAVFLSTQTIAGAANAWVNPIALDAIHWKYYGVYVAIDAILLIIIWFYFPETKNRTIKEIGELFDGIDASGVSQVKASKVRGDDAEHVGTVQEVEFS